MRLPRTDRDEVDELLGVTNPHAALLMANGSVRTGLGEILVAQWGRVGMMNPQMSYEAWCRRAARVVHTIQPIGPDAVVGAG